MLPMFAGFFIILFISTPLAKRIIRHYKLSKKLLSLFFLLFWIGGSALWLGITYGGGLLYEKIINPKLNEIHTKNFSEEKAQIIINDFQSKQDCFADCDSLIFILTYDGGYLIPKDSIINKYKNDRNYKYYNITEDIYKIEDTLLIENVVCNNEKLKQNVLLTSNNGVYFKKIGAVSLSGGYQSSLLFDSFILNSTTKPIKKIVFKIEGLSQVFNMGLTTNKPNSFQIVRENLDKNNSFSGFGLIDYEITDVIFDE